MKVLFVCGGNSKYGISPFIKGQGESLIKNGVQLDYFLIKGKGVFGYLKNLPKLNIQIKKQKYDLIHAHYGFSGLLCILQRKAPVIITFHGSDINNSYHRKFSNVAMRLSSYNIFVHKIIKEKVNAKRNYSIIPCGVNLHTFYPIDRQQCREKLGLENSVIYILFSSSFDNSVKNYFLANRVLMNFDKNVKLMELKGYSRNQVNFLMNACNLLLMTSFSEGSPQIIKEAMACNLPIVSTDVGDVREVIGKTEGCYITSYETEDVAEKIKKTLTFGKRTNGRTNIHHLEINTIARRIISIYEKVLK